MEGLEGMKGIAGDSDEGIAGDRIYGKGWDSGGASAVIMDEELTDLHEYAMALSCSGETWTDGIPMTWRIQAYCRLHDQGLEPIRCPSVSLSSLQADPFPDEDDEQDHNRLTKMLKSSEASEFNIMVYDSTANECKWLKWVQM